MAVICNTLHVKGETTMTIGLVGRKCGSTRIFTEDGACIPVTVIEVEANRVTQVKTADSDGYRALQITTGTRKANRTPKPLVGHFAKAGVAAGRSLWEFRDYNIRYRNGSISGSIARRRNETTSGGKFDPKRNERKKNYPFEILMTSLQKFFIF